MAASAQTKKTKQKKVVETVYTHLLIEESFTGEVRDSNNTLVGSYVYFHKDRQEELDKILRQLVAIYKEAPFKLTIDLETNGLIPQLCSILLVSICFDGKNSLVFPFFHVDKTAFYELLETIPISNQNLVFDYDFLIHHTNITPKFDICTMQMAKFAYAGLIDGFALDNLCSKIFNYQLDKTKRLPFVKCTHDSLFTLEQLEYAAGDSIYAYQLAEHLENRIHNEKVSKVWENIDKKIQPIYALRGYIGFKVDKDSLLTYSEVAYDKIKAYEEQFKELYNNIPEAKKSASITEFKISSNPNAIFLFGYHGYHTTSLAKDIREEFLKLNPTDEFLNLYETYKEEYNFYTKFLKPNVEKIASSTDESLRIYPRIQTNGTVTGRLSSKGPNIMAFSEQARALISAEDNCYIVSCDASAYEFRAAAAKTGEPLLIKAFQDRATLYPKLIELCSPHGFQTPDDFLKQVFEKQKFLDTLSSTDLDICKAFLCTDIHRVNAGKIFNKEPFDVTNKERKIAKTLGYAVLYGSGPTTILVQLSKEGIFLEFKEADQLIKKFFEIYPLIEQAIKECHSQLKIKDKESTLYRPQYSLRTYLGRKRYFTYPPKYLKAQFSKQQKDAEREGFNFYFQGACSDAIKYAVPKLEEYYASLYGMEIEAYRNIEWIKSQNYSITQFLTTVHDEAVSVVHEDHLQQVLIAKPKILEAACSLSVGHKVPMEISVSYGKLWPK